MPWPVGHSVGLSHPASLVTYRWPFFVLLARLVLPGKFPKKASVGAVRRGEAAFLGVSHDDAKGKNSSE